MPKIARVCPVCGTTFYDWPSDYRVTCSYRCARAHVRPDGTVEADCAHCGIHFTTIASQPAKYCSRECYVAAHGSAEHRFWSHVPNRPDDGCWLWNGVVRDFYGTFKSQGVTYHAHQYSFILHHGPIPDGHVIRHTCDVRSCVRPSHLITGTAADNMRDREDRNRHPHTGPRKLTDEQVAQVRAMLAGGATGGDVARHFGVSEGLISLIKTGKHRS